MKGENSNWFTLKWHLWVCVCVYVKPSKETHKDILNVSNIFDAWTLWRHVNDDMTFHSDNDYYSINWCICRNWSANTHTHRKKRTLMAIPLLSIMVSINLMCILYDMCSHNKHFICVTSKDRIAHGLRSSEYFGRKNAAVCVIQMKLLNLFTKYPCTPNYNRVSSYFMAFQHESN